jgi:DNA-binding response OmpR family regulator
MRVLVVEDEVELRQALARGLQREGYAVDVAADGEDALLKLAVAPYDLLCLDLGLPGLDGRELCRRVRAQGARLEGRPLLRILILTARDGLGDRVGGLDDGADDYLVKPFAFAELCARIRALLRRDTPQPDATLMVGDIVLDATRHEAQRAGSPLGLTAKEFALLQYLMLHAGEALSAEHLLYHVWDENADPFTNTVRVTIGTLRRKLERPGLQQPIETLVGRGYRLRALP